MPDKFIVPQFIDNEDKILGPITVRQFLIMLAAAFLLFLEYKLPQVIIPEISWQLPVTLITGLLTIVLAGTFGFVKIYGQPFHLFFINALQTLMRPNLRVWNKQLDDAQLRALMVVKAVPETAVTPTKPRPASSHLRDLTLVVNTGGVYRPENDE